MLKLFYITNKPEIALIAEAAGVDRIFVDMEYIGKELRQPNMDTVKNRHTVEDVKKIREVITKSELLVRVNPISDYSEDEINDVISAGADVIMLPMWESADDVKRFLNIVNARAKTIILLETDKAAKCIDEILLFDGIDEIHIGLNDLHLSQNKKFLFELLVDGTVDSLISKIKKSGIPYGFGGVGRVTKNAPIPAKNVLAEHYRLNSSMVILSRAFCNTENYSDLDELKKSFFKGISENREYELFLSKQNDYYFEKTHQDTKAIIDGIVSKL